VLGQDAQAGCSPATSASASVAKPWVFTKNCRLSIGSITTPERWLIETLCLIFSVPR
jgi:hypothetical protein